MISKRVQFEYLPKGWSDPIYPIGRVVSVDGEKLTITARFFDGLIRVKRNVADVTFIQVKDD